MSLCPMLPRTGLGCQSSFLLPTEQRVRTNVPLGISARANGTETALQKFQREFARLFKGPLRVASGNRSARFDDLLAFAG